MIFRSTVFLCMSLVFSGQLLAEKKSPTWMFEFHAGLFEPELSDWDQHYGNEKFPELGFSYAYRFLSVIDVGASIGYGKDRGTGQLLSNSAVAGSVEYQIIPIEIFALLRGRVYENQWIVPYIGGGYTRFVYRQEIVGQSKAQGSVNGSHVRMGLQFLLDALDQTAAQGMYRRWGVLNSYLYFDYKQTTAEVNDIALGGNSYKVGVMFEF